MEIFTLREKHLPGPLIRKGECQQNDFAALAHRFKSDRFNPSLDWNPLSGLLDQAALPVPRVGRGNESN
jgi:hypothetical protein